ncbi:MAG: GTP-binding protein [Methanomassiliicoccales archaeon]
MELIVIAGFLGSGKTTLILATVSKIIERTGKKIVIIVNDFGKIGIDGKIMEKYGLRVQELASGCICCTLGPDFISTLKTVATQFEPDIIIVEPTGIADPQAILNSLEMYNGPPICKVLTVVIVDAIRFSVIIKALERPFRAQIRAAGLVLINKIDEIENEEAIREMESRIKEFGSSSPIIPVSATEGTNLDSVVDFMVVGTC